MIDRYGRWHAETDYSSVPKEQMCVCDYIAQWIIKAEDYEVLTTLDNLVLNIVSVYDGGLKHSGKSYFTVPNARTNTESLATDIIEFVCRKIGRFAEFDYWMD